MAKANNAMEFDFTNDKPEVVKGKSSKEIDLKEYMNPKYAKEYAQKAADKTASGSNELDRLIEQSKMPGLRAAILNKELVDGFKMVYAEKNPAQLRDIIANEHSKPWEVAAARAIQKDKMLTQQKDQKIPSDKQRNTTPDEEEEELG